jgi:hypothetical protein
MRNHLPAPLAKGELCYVIVGQPLSNLAGEVRLESLAHEIVAKPRRGDEFTGAMTGPACLKSSESEMK